MMVLCMASELFITLIYELYECSWIEILWLLLFGLLKFVWVIGLDPYYLLRIEKLLLAWFPCAILFSCVFAFIIHGWIGVFTKRTLFA